MAPRVDASGVAVELPRPPRRIVSLIPSTTEILAGWGSAMRSWGSRSIASSPATSSGKTRIGGEKNPDLEKIRALAPDLVVANIEENRREDIDRLRAWSIPVWVTYPRTVAEGIQLVGELAN